MPLSIESALKGQICKVSYSCVSTPAQINICGQGKALAFTTRLHYHIILGGFHIRESMVCRAVIEFFSRIEISSEIIEFRNITNIESILIHIAEVHP